MNNIMVSFRDVNIYFSKVKALDNFSIDFKSGSIHALIGEHGSGKSSIGLSLCGLKKIDSGSIIIDSQNYNYIKTKVAKNKRFALVHQQLLLNPYFTVAENLTFCDKSTPFFSIMLKKKMIEKSNEFINSLGFNIDVSRITKDLTLSEKALIAILAKIKNNPKILILDECLDKISSEYYSQLKAILISLRAKGCCIIIMTHKIDWVYDIADMVSVIRSGSNLLTENISGIDKMQIIKIAYTQFSETPVYHNNEKSIYHLIKYNEAILENLPVNLVIINNDGILKLANKYFLNSFKLNLLDFIEKPSELLFNETIVTTKNMIFNQQKKSEENTIFHLSISINKIEGIFNVHYSPIYDNGCKIGSMYIFYDITEYDLLQKNDQLTEKLSSVGLLAAGVAHEINNPLEIISNYLTNIRFRYNDTILLSIVDKLSKQVTYITKIVSNLQNFSDLDKVVPENTNINDLIKEMINLLKINAKLKNIEIKYIEKRENNIVYVNENELKQAVLNIFKNSFESIGKNGEVEIIVDRIAIYGIDSIEIIIKDTGVGIEDGKDYFTPFYSTKSNNGINTGLGLSLVYGIVKKYKGTISINNRNDRNGCIVRIIFPVIIDM